MYWVDIIVIVDFDPGIGVHNLTAVGSSDIFLLKLNDMGEFIWVKSMGGTEFEFPTDLVLDEDENIYFTGTIEGEGRL